MTAITRIGVYLATHQYTAPGTEPDLYLALAGREFHLTSHDPAARLDTGAEFTYVLGEGANVDTPDRNDPRKPQLALEDLAKYPAYLRVNSHSVFPDWVIDRITVTVHAGENDTAVYDNPNLAGPNTFLHLGPTTGERVFLTRV